MTEEKKYIMEEINEAMKILVKSVGSTVAPEMRIEFIKESYHILYRLMDNIDE